MPRAVAYMEDLGFRVTEDIQDEDGTTYAAWMRRKPTVHDTAMTGGDGPADAPRRLRHAREAQHHRDLRQARRAAPQSDRIERGPGRHGVSNAFYLYLRDPDGHRVEIYTQDYYTGDPDNPVVTWDVHDNQRRDWWGNPVVPSWYTEASLVLDLDGNPQPLTTRTDDSEMEVTIGADGFSYTRKGDEPSRASSSARRSRPRVARRRPPAFVTSAPRRPGVNVTKAGAHPSVTGTRPAGRPPAGSAAPRARRAARAGRGCRRAPGRT